MGDNTALPQAQACGTPNAEPENSFRFTPIKALRALPRLWERKPSTPFRAGLKSRKLWKRFSSSFTNMKSFQSSTILEDDALQTAIRVSKDSGYARGVKRLCVQPGDSKDHANIELHQAGQSFLETKWEAPAAGKRRKLPDVPIKIFDESLHTGPAVLPGKSDTAYTDITMTNSPQAPETLQSLSQTIITNFESQHRISNPPVSDATTVEDHQSRPPSHEQCATTDNTVKDESSAITSANSTTVHNLSQQQEGTLVRSALRSSLDGEDAELLNDFLSKAQAKRAAKAALVDMHGNMAQDLSRPSESPKEECAAPRSRRALEALDANSPSPVKVFVSPSKMDATPGDKPQENETGKNVQDDEPAPASPTCRRSARVKAPSATAPPMRNTIALRRAKGNEFVFLQRTEAQQLALATKRNTRMNRGNSLMPQAALEAMAQKENQEWTTIDEDGQEALDCNLAKGRRPNASRKHVSWNEERLVEYEDERLTSEEPVEEGSATGHVGVSGAFRPDSGSKRTEKKVTASTRSSRSQNQHKTDQDAVDAEPEGGLTAATTATTAYASATPRSRRVRRLGDSTMISGTPVKTGSGRINKPPVAAVSVTVVEPSTPTKARRKLIPKSPSVSLLPPSTSKSVKSTTDQPFVSGIPTRRTSISASEGTTRKAMLQSSAGCTPMPRRVRART